VALQSGDGSDVAGARVALFLLFIVLISADLVGGCSHDLDSVERPCSLDTDGDGRGDDGCDDDDDNDGAVDDQDVDPVNPARCADVDADGCDDCAIGYDGLGVAADNDPANDGPDIDGDGACDGGDGDVDNDGLPNSDDRCPIGVVNWASSTATDHDADGCRDIDEDADDDGDGVADLSDLCATGATGWVSTILTDFDGDGCKDSGAGEDDDNDNDGVNDTPDPENENPSICGDVDADGCDDCAIGTDRLGPQPDNTPNNDGPDADGDGACDAGDSNDAVSTICGINIDADACDDCASGMFDPPNDGCP
jgi:large repetitive protein